MNDTQAKGHWRLRQDVTVLVLMNDDDRFSVVISGSQGTAQVYAMESASHPGKGAFESLFQFVPDPPDRPAT